MLSTVSGGLMARRAKGVADVVGATCIGDGGTSTGSFHEGLNMRRWKNSRWSSWSRTINSRNSTPTSRQYACADIIDRAIGYGVRGYKTRRD